MKDLIADKSRYSWGGEAYGETDAAAIEGLLVGHKVTKVADDHLLLDDGTLLKLIGNEGGCSCSAGDYELTELNGVDNIITRVEVADERTDGGYGEMAGSYRIYVFADNQQINLATFTGGDGNGYYGTGFEILVKRGAAPEAVS